MSDNIEPDHVTLNLLLTAGGTPREGFGTSMILSHNAMWDERSRSYNGIAAAAEDWPSTSPEYRALNAAFAQTPQPTEVKVGRSEVAVTQKYEIEVGTVVNSKIYRALVKGQGFEDATVEITSGSSATADAIIASLLTAFNAVVGKNYLATIVVDSSGGDTLVVTGAAPGNWFSIEVEKPTYLSIRQTHTVTGMADDLSALIEEDPDWYCLLILYPSTDYILDTAAWVETNKRILVVDENETESITTAANVGADLGVELLELGYTRTMLAYHHAPDQFLSAAHMGRWLPTLPGKSDPVYKTLVGITRNVLTPTQLANLKARRMNTYKRAGQKNITWEGMVASTTNKFLDTTRKLDWLSDRIIVNTYDVFIQSEVLPYSPEGIQMVGSGIHEAFDEGQDQGVLLKDFVNSDGDVVETTSVTLPAFEDIDDSDIADGILRGIVGKARIQSNVHKAIIDVNVTY